MLGGREKLTIIFDYNTKRRLESAQQRTGAGESGLSVTVSAERSSLSNVLWVSVLYLFRLIKTLSVTCFSHCLICFSLSLLLLLCMFSVSYIL